MAPESETAGHEPVSLDLATEAYGSDGKPVAEGMFAVTPLQLTVPAGGDATATVTADTRVGTADGTFRGSLTATTADGATTARTAIGVHREVESYDLTIKHVGLDGKADGDGTTGVHGLDNSVSKMVGDADGEVTLRARSSTARSTPLAESPRSTRQCPSPPPTAGPGGARR